MTAVGCVCIGCCDCRPAGAPPAGGPPTGVGEPPSWPRAVAPAPNWNEWSLLPPWLASPIGMPRTGSDPWLEQDGSIVPPQGYEPWLGMAR